MAASAGVALDSGMAFIPVGWVVDVTIVWQPCTLAIPLGTPPQFDPAPLALRI